MILVVQQGMDAGQQVQLDRGVMSIGRGPDCDVVLQERHASRRHAELRRHGDQWFIVDLGSTNGTYVRDVRLEANVPEGLPPGTQVAIGSTRFALREEAPDRLAPGPYPQAPVAWAEEPAPAGVSAQGSLAGDAGSAARDAAIWICRMVVVAGCGLMSLGALRDWIEVQIQAPLIGTTLYQQTYSGIDSGQGWLFLGVAAIAVVLILVDIAIPRWGLISGLGQMSAGIVVIAVNAIDVYRYYRAGTQEFMGIRLLDLLSRYAGHVIDITIQAGVYLMAIGLVLLVLGGLSRVVLAAAAFRKV